MRGLIKFGTALGIRLMVGRQILDLKVKVRILDPQPIVLPADRGAFV